MTTPLETPQSITTFTQYYELARKTMIYPNHGENLVYPTLGLVGETGEIAEKVKKIYRDNQGEVDEDRRVALSKEIGDVMWYLAALCYEYRVSMSDVAMGRDSISEYDLVITNTMIPRRNSLRLDTQVLRLSSNVGHLVTLCTNSFMDLQFDKTRDQKIADSSQTIVSYLGAVLRIICEISGLLGLHLSDICQMNIAKLYSRFDRGVIQGSGDNR